MLEKIHLTGELSVCQPPVHRLNLPHTRAQLIQKLQAIRQSNQELQKTNIQENLNKEEEEEISRLAKQAIMEANEVLQDCSSIKQEQLEVRLQLVIFKDEIREVADESRKVNDTFNQVKEELPVVKEKVREINDGFRAVNAELRGVNEQYALLRDKSELIQQKVELVEKSLEQDRVQHDLEKLEREKVALAIIDVRKQQQELNEQLKALEENETQMQDGMINHQLVSHIWENCSSTVFTTVEKISSVADETFSLANSAKKFVGQWAWSKTNGGYGNPISWVALGVFAAIFSKQAFSKYPLITIVVGGTSFFIVKDIVMPIAKFIRVINPF